MSKSFRLFSAVFLLGLMFSPPTFAIMLRGDWESSGDLPMIYVPPYSFEYRCQLEITDHKLHFIDGQDRTVYAVAELVLNNKTAYRNSADLKWLTVIRDHERGQDRVLTDKLPFEVYDAGLALYFRPAAHRTNPEKMANDFTKDQVTLWASVSLKIGDEFVADDQRVQKTREAVRLNVKTSISSRTRDYSGGQSRSLFVDCEKLK